MDSTNREYVCRVQASTMRAWLVYSEAQQVWTAEVYLRTAGGVQFLEKRYTGDLPFERVLIADVAKLGWFSDRPALLGNAFDPSMSHPVLALFLHCCWCRKYDAAKLLSTAFPLISEDRKVIAVDIAAQAAWEGTEYPDDWSDPALVGRLLVALDQVGYRTVADALLSVLTNGG